MEYHRYFLFLVYLLFCMIVGCTGQACNAGPCLNEGACTDTAGGGFTCACTPPFGGTKCEKVCSDSDPCDNNGVCSADQNSCTCVDGTSGVRCGTIDSLCFSNPCNNEATCMGDDSSFTCTCTAGFTGNTCDTPVPVETDDSDSSDDTGEEGEEDEDERSEEEDRLSVNEIVAILLAFVSALGHMLRF